MQSLFEKARSLVLGNLHSLLDREIDKNSIPVHRQYIRDLEEAKAAIADEAAVARSRVTRAKQEVTNLETRLETTNENVELLLSDEDEGNDAQATKLAEQAILLEEDLDGKRGEIADLETVSSAINQALEQVTSRHATMLRNLRRLEQLDSSTRAKNQAAQALGRVASVTGGAPSIDGLESRMRDQAAVADARFDQALANTATDDDPDKAVLASKAAQRVAEMKARLKAATKE